MHLWSDIVFLKIRSRIFHSVSQLFRNARDSKSIFVDGNDYISRVVEVLFANSLHYYNDKHLLIS